MLANGTGLIGYPLAEHLLQLRAIDAVEVGLYVRSIIQLTSRSHGILWKTWPLRRPAALIA